MVRVQSLPYLVPALLVGSDHLMWSFAKSLSVVENILLIQEHRLHTRRLMDLPAVSESSDFDDRHGNIAFSSDRRYLFA